MTHDNRCFDVSRDKQGSVGKMPGLAGFLEVALE
jgi:hypothetical protein